MSAHQFGERGDIMTDRIDPFASAVDMLAALRARRLSAVELLELHQSRIARHNPELHAIVEPAVVRTTAAMTECKDFRSEHDAPVTQRVKGAGAIVMAKTNVPQMLSDWQSSNPVYGRSNNPWDLERTPGGSTGGGAAALAAGLTPLEFGSDIGGSIRVPAAFCGVYGHRPSETAMPRSGQFPMPPMPNAAVVMGVQGPLARSAADPELALDGAAGPEIGEGVAWRL